ncbi:hypothetical protein D3C76_1793410 [compost metagenome]
MPAVFDKNFSVDILSQLFHQTVLEQMGMEYILRSPQRLMLLEFKGQDGKTIEIKL